jgi:outer membrane protein assembly factor BamB
MLLKLNCQCGQRYSFDVEPVNGQMPFTVACPICGADGTANANALLAQISRTQSAPSASAPAAVPAEAAAPAGKPRLRVSGAAHAPAAAAPVAAAAGAPAAAPAGERCNRHLDKTAAAHCTVCKKPICPECMSMFGYLCSVNCRYQAEQQGIKVPKYKFQKRSVEAREFRKGALITVAVIAVIAVLIGGWYWYDYAGAKPKLADTIKTPGDHETYSQFLGDNKLLMVSPEKATLHDLKTKQDVWSTDIKETPRERPKPADDTADEAVPATAGTPQQRAIGSALKAKLRGATATKTATPVKAATKSAAKPVAAQAPVDDSDDDESDLSYGFSGFSSYGTPRVVTDAENVWVCSGNALKCLDAKTGALKKTIPIDGQLMQFTASDNNLLLVTAPNATRRLLTRIETPSGNTTTNEVIVPRPAKKTLKKGELPEHVEPTARYLLHRELEDRKLYRPQVIQTSSEFFASGENLVELRVRLVEPKLVSVETMKKKGPSVVNGNLSASSSATAVASEIFNDLKRSETGGVREVDNSTYAVTIRRYAGKEPLDWTNSVVGVPMFFAFKTVDVLIADKKLIAFDKQNKKLFDSTLTYGLAENYSESSAPPGVEMDGVLYFYDQGHLTAFDLPGGNVRWRLPSVGITAIQSDAKGMLYIDTSSAAPESIQYSDQITFDKIDSVLLKVDPKTGKTIWKSVNHGAQHFLTGKYLYGSSSFVGGLGLGNALRDALGMATSGPRYFHLYRIDPGNGDLIWDYSNNQDGSPRQIDFQNNKIALNYGSEIRIMKMLQIF